MTISSPSRPYLDGKKLNKIEQNKAAKDGLLVGSEIENSPSSAGSRLMKLTSSCV